jgi:type I restriction enzyme S subunit
MSGHEDFRLPPGWEEKSISQVTIKTKQRDPRRTPHQKFRYVDVASISRELFKITSPAELFGVDAPSRARKEIQENDVLFATVRPTLRRIAIVPAELNGAIASTGYCVLRSDLQQLDPRFLYFYLLTDHFNSRMAGLERGVSYPAVSDSDVTNSRIPLPPLPEQKAISHSLSAVQRAIEAQEHIIQTTTELKQALMQKLFSEGLRGETQKETEIGLVPESWEVMRLEYIAKSFEYGTSVKCGHDVQGKPVLRIPNVVGGVIKISDIKFGNPKPNEKKNLRLQAGDLLFVRTNGVKENAGRCSLFKDEIEDCYFASYLIRVRLDTCRLNPSFLNEYSQTGIGMSFLSGKAIRTADGKFNINAGTLKTMLVPVPAIEEQEEIARVLALVDTKSAKARSKQSELQELFRALLHELMTAKKRVHSTVFEV